MRGSSRTCRILVTLALSVGLQPACKQRRLDSAAKSTRDIALADEEVLPDYKPKFIDVDANHPNFTTDFTVVPSALQPGFEAMAAGLISTGQGDPAAFRHFFTIYAWQGVGPLNLPKYTHTFAVFARVEGPDLERDTIRYFTVSWDAADGIIAMALPAKAGRNFTLAESYALRDDLGVTTEMRRSRMVEIRKELYDQAFLQFTRISQGSASGSVSYKMMDDLDGRQLARRSMPGGYLNCQHAVSDILARPDGSLLETGMARGFSAGDLVYEWFSNNFISRDPGLEIVAQRIRLQKPAN